MKSTIETPINRLPEVARELARVGRRITCVHLEGETMRLHVRGTRKVKK